jgi:hypothetical protein
VIGLVAHLVLQIITFIDPELPFSKPLAEKPVIDARVRAGRMRQLRRDLLSTAGAGDLRERHVHRA